MFFIICRYRTFVMNFKETFASVTRPSTCRFSASSSVSSIEATNRVFSAVYTALWMSRACRKKNRGKNLISKSLPRISLIISIQTLFLDCRLCHFHIRLFPNRLHCRCMWSVCALVWLFSKAATFLALLFYRSLRLSNTYLYFNKMQYLCM